ncbi:MAG: hypothetical protein LBQ12_10230 [Deltaproteobacteria bacterium]|nr:hypothetical protein [Deltaproteobacteria bacterium]
MRSRIAVAVCGALALSLAAASLNAASEPPPPKQWLKKYGGEAADSFRSIAATSDGGLVASGYSYSARGDVEHTRGWLNAWIVKVDAAGAVEFKRSLGASIGGNATWAEQTSDGGYVAGGSAITGNGDFKMRSKGKDDAFVLRLDRSGRTVFLKTYGGKEDDRLASVMEKPDGGFPLLGTTKSAAAGEGCGPGPGGSEMLWAAALDAGGRQSGGACRAAGGAVRSLNASADGLGGAALTLSLIGGEGGDASFDGTAGPGAVFGELREIPADGPRDVRGTASLRGGGLAGAGSRPAPSLGGPDCRDPWLFGFGADLGLGWQAFLRTGRSGRLSAVARAKGRYFAAGPTAGPGAGEGPCGRGDAMAVMADSGGNVIWEIVLIGKDYDDASAVAVHADGSLAVAGTSVSRDGDFEHPEGPARFGGDDRLDGFILKLAPASPAVQGVGDARPER